MTTTNKSFNKIVIVENNYRRLEKLQAMFSNSPDFISDTITLSSIYKYLPRNWEYSPRNKNYMRERFEVVVKNFIDHMKHDRAYIVTSLSGMEISYWNYILKKLRDNNIPIFALQTDYYEFGIPIFADKIFVWSEAKKNKLLSTDISIAHGTVALKPENIIVDGIFGMDRLAPQFVQTEKAKYLSQGEEKILLYAFSREHLVGDMMVDCSEISRWAKDNHYFPMFYVKEDDSKALLMRNGYFCISALEKLAIQMADVILVQDDEYATLVSALNNNVYRFSTDMVTLDNSNCTKDNIPLFKIKSYSELDKLLRPRTSKKMNSWIKKNAPTAKYQYLKIIEETLLNYNC